MKKKLKLKDLREMNKLVVHSRYNQFNFEQRLHQKPYNQKQARKTEIASGEDEEEEETEIERSQRDE